jgi:hypothetical protein
MTYTNHPLGDHRQRPVTLDGVTGDVLIPLPAVAREFGRTRRTLGRWLKDPALGFPPIVKINGRGYVYRSALETWKRSRTLASISASFDTVA